jgi:hypothetical protein
MIGILRQLLFLAIAAVISWWFLLEGGPVTLTSPPEEPRVPDQIALLPISRPPAEAPEQPAEPESAASELVAVTPPISELPEDESQLQQEPPVSADSQEQPSADEVPEPAGEATSELGDPDTEGDEAAEARSAPESLMSDSALLDAAQRELSGEVQRGFATDLMSDPTEQLEIARAFGEELVLVPRSSLETSVDQQVYFRLTEGGEVQRAVGLGHVDAVRYRDFFQFEYAKLPEPIRRLRKSVLNRGEVYLFAGLIPVQEWALVVGRRERALQASGREIGAVRRFTLDYERLGDGRYDIVVDEILFTDGTRFRPANETP